MANSTRDRIDVALEVAGLSTGVFCVLAGIGMFAGQAVWWLRFGAWPGLMVSDGFAFVGLSMPVTDWLGLAQILDWLSALPLGVGIAGAGILAGWALARFAEPVSRPGD